MRQVGFDMLGTEQQIIPTLNISGMPQATIISDTEAEIAVIKAKIAVL